VEEACGEVRATRVNTVARAEVRSATIGFTAVALLGFDQGGYFQRSWGWAMLAFAAAVALALLLREELTIGLLEWVSLAALVALAGWMLTSNIWGIPGTEAAREAERTLVYLAGFSAVLALVHTKSVRGLLAGVLGGIVALASYGLGDRVLGSHGLLVKPLGYANALGILAAIGLVIALGALIRKRRPLLTALIVAVVVLLGTALALTSSRGAWLSLACGLAVLGILDPRPQRWYVGRRWVLTGVAVVVAVVILVALTSEAGLGERSNYWRAAIADARAHPISGSGAGSFDDYWFAHRDAAANVRDAHSLYLESLAELGPVGLLLVLAVLIPPLAAAAIARADPTVAVAAGGYAAFLVHAGLDWDWEVPATTLAGLACGAALLVAVRPISRPLSVRARSAGVAVALALCVLALIVVFAGP
jgi:hypothetical protein